MMRWYFKTTLFSTDQFKHVDLVELLVLGTVEYAQLSRNSPLYTQSRSCVGWWFFIYPFHVSCFLSRGRVELGSRRKDWPHEYQLGKNVKWCSRSLPSGVVL